MKLTRNLLLFILVFTFQHAWSQSFSIKGILRDTTGEPLSLASIFFLNPSDTILIEYVRADEDGVFHAQGLNRRPYLVRCNYVGFLPHEVIVTPEQGGMKDLGVIVLKPISTQLFEVVIKEARAPLIIKGDTIEYDASAFKVPEGSTMEELLKKLPGIEVENDGSIKADGKDVTKVTVDGKRFFGDDPKQATKNLPAEGIKKVQVFDNVDEQKKLTGYSSRPSDKAINVEMKDEFKKGGFGKIAAGGGTEERLEIKGNYNQFNDKWQLSLIGVANNTGRNGLGWNDYQDFRGSNSFNWNDGGDFGFAESSGRRYILLGSSDSEDNDELSSGFFSGEANGFPKKYSAGVNLNYDWKKTKLSSMYFYNLDKLDRLTTTESQYFIPEGNYFRDENRKSTNSNFAHAADIRVEHSFDSATTLVSSFKSNLGSKRSDQNLISESISENQQKLNDLKSDNFTDNDIQYVQGSMIFRKKLKKKGRAMAWSGSYSLNNSVRDLTQDAYTNYYDNNALDSFYILDQLTESINKKQLFKTAALYVEPIKKRFFSESFVNYFIQKTDYNRDVFNQEQALSIPDSTLTRLNDNRVYTARIGSSIRYSYNGLNISLGAALQNIKIVGDYSWPLSGVDYSAEKNYNNVLPNFELNYDMKRNRWFSLNYGMSVNEPSVRDLIPVIDLTNPISIFVGNPDLNPELRHRFNGELSKHSRATSMDYGFSATYTLTEDKIIRSQEVDSFSVTKTQPINFGKGHDINGGLRFGFPVIQNKLTVRLNYNTGYSLSSLLINQVASDVITLRHTPSVRVNITLVDWFSLFLNGRMSFSTTDYESNELKSQKLENANHSAELNFKFPFGLFWSTSFAYSSVKNLTTDYFSETPILNSSLYYLFLKNKRAEIRLSAYDVLNKNQGISQVAQSNYLTTSVTETLSRYLMLTLSYNMRGFKTSLQKNRGWWD